MNVGWAAEMEKAIAGAGEAPARLRLRGETFVLLPAEEYARVRDLVRGIPDVDRVLDPVRNIEYALMPLGAYERIKPLFEEDPITLEERKAALRAAGLRAGWNDPVWDDLERETPPT